MTDSPMTDERRADLLLEGFTQVQPLSPDARAMFRSLILESMPRIRAGEDAEAVLREILAR